MTEKMFQDAKIVVDRINELRNMQRLADVNAVTIKVGDKILDQFSLSNYAMTAITNVIKSEIASVIAAKEKELDKL